MDISNGSCRSEAANAKGRIEPENPAFGREADSGQEKDAAEITETNEALERAYGGSGSDADEPDLDAEIEGAGHSVDERMPAGSESPEDKATDVINSGILRL